MPFTSPEDAAIVEQKLIAEVRQLQLFLTAGCKQSPTEQITSGKLQERKVNTIARLNELYPELHEVRVWLKEYRRSLCAPNPLVSKRRTVIVWRNKLKRALENISMLDGNEEAVTIAKQVLFPLNESQQSAEVMPENEQSIEGN